MKREMNSAAKPTSASALASVGLKSRLRWIDSARGLGILLVVYAHGARALPDILPRPEVFRQIDTVIYSFHMPLFFLLAGLVSARPLDSSCARYLSQKITTVVYPYLLWSTVYWSLEVVFAHQVNSPIAPGAILEILWRPIEHLWFLYALFLCQIIAAVLWPSRALLTILSLWMFFGPLPAFTVPGLWTGFPWFTAGLILAPVAAKPASAPLLQMAAALATAAAFAVLALVFTGGPVWLRLDGFLVAGVGIFVTLGLAIASQANRALVYLGEASLSIYLLHTIFSAGTRVVFNAIYPLDPLVLLGVTVLAGVVGPLVVHELARRMRIAQYLGLGKLASAGEMKTARAEQSG